MFSDDRAAREAMLAELSDALGAAPIQHIGKLLVLWRPMPPKEKAEREDRGAGPKVVKVLKFSQERQPPAAGQEDQGAGQPAHRRRRRAQARPQAPPTSLKKRRDR